MNRAGPTIDGEADEPEFEAVAIVARGRTRGHVVALAVVAVGLVVAAVIGKDTLPAPVIADATPSPTEPVFSPSPAATRDALPRYMAIDPGPYEVPWPEGRIAMTMPSGWSSAASAWTECPCWRPQGGTTITPYPLEDGSPTLTLNLVHDVEFVVEDLCASQRQTRSGAVGPTVEDLTAALVNQRGAQRSGPTAVTLGGFPARRFVLTMSIGGPNTCPGPEGRTIWDNASSYGFAILDGGTATVYIVDVNGERLVITSLDRGASADHAAQLEAIVASIEIEHRPSSVPSTEFVPSGELAIGRHAMTVGGIPLSIEVSRSGAGNTQWDSNGVFYISKSIQGPQGAEAAILWTTVPDGVYPFPCLEAVDLEAARSAEDLAALVAGAPADPIDRRGPSDVIVGGRPAKHVAFTIGNDTGCEPGFFYTWPAIYGGPLWAPMRPGDTIGVWIVDVDGVLLFIEGTTTREANAAVEEELQMFIDSIAFE